MVVAALIVFGALVAAWLVAPAEERRAVRPIPREAALRAAA
jgi:hypothetical protein